MRSFLMLSWLASLLVFAAPGLAEEPAHPDFSGRWTVEVPAAPPPPVVPPTPGVPGPPTRGDLGSGWGSPLTITQDAERLTVGYAFFATGDLQAPLTFTFALDGTETKNAVRMGRGLQEQRAHARWDAGKLVLVSTHSFVDPTTRVLLPVDVTQTLSLDGSTGLLVETTRAGVLGGAPTATRVRYVKP